MYLLRRRYINRLQDYAWSIHEAIEFKKENNVSMEKRVKGDKGLS